VVNKDTYTNTNYDSIKTSGTLKRVENYTLALGKESYQMSNGGKDGR